MEAVQGLCEWYDATLKIFLTTKSADKLNPAFLQQMKYFKSSYSRDEETLQQDLNNLVDNFNLSSAEDVFHCAVYTIVYSNGNLDNVALVLKRKVRSADDAFQHALIRKLQGDRKPVPELIKLGYKLDTKPPQKEVKPSTSKGKTPRKRRTNMEESEDVSKSKQVQEERVIESLCKEFETIQSDRVVADTTQHLCVVNHNRGQNTHKLIYF